MRTLYLSKSDIRFHFMKNSRYYYSFLCAIIFSLVISVIVIISNNGYLNLLVSSNKILYSLINGTAILKEIFWNRFLTFSFPLILVLFLGINYYLALLSFLIVMYQFVVFIMTVYAVVEMYGFTGLLNNIFMIVPVNLLFFACLIFLSVVCLERAKSAQKNRYFAEGYNSIFLIKVGVCFLFVLALSSFVAFIYPAILKSAIFSIF